MRDRLVEAASKKPRGNSKAYVEVIAGDLAALCEQIPPGKDWIADAQRQGAKGDPDRTVALYSDHLHHLLELTAEG